ncbi:MAG: hypothetical protein C4527_12835 [Candidatus Omnitrophota bacterium]|jgi:hypothetical protein|nr:MAG: hypothetical protein C4527_12835 [Candidatus Omnitrophota bacterium]
MKVFYLKFILAVFIVFISNYAWCEEEYIPKELLDIDKIRTEEQLSPKSQLMRVYIFLAVLNTQTNSYDTYVTKGKNDLDSDGQTALQEPNDLKEYKNVATDFANAFTIENEEYVCYINDMPEFNELFPEQKNPFEQNNTLLGICTKTIDGNEKVLTGTKTIPSMSNDGSNLIVDRYCAFYQKNEGGHTIKSYGFIEIQLQESTS